MTAPIDPTRDIALVVDDSPETLGMLTDALEESGISVLVARDGLTALRLVERVAPDVILLDAVMPGLDGFDTCRRLKRNSTLSHIPVVFMTGLGETNDIVKGLQAGGVDYLVKPIAPDELIARISVHIANARFAFSARSALDATGSSVLAVNSDGIVLWASPKAVRLLETCNGILDRAGGIVKPDVLEWIALCAGQPVSRAKRHWVTDHDGREVKLSFVGRSGVNELLLRIDAGSDRTPAETLRERLNLTAREAEVLYWISEGKANRDVAEILSLSPRTINKHLEQIYAKVGVENRTTAAIVALRALE